MGNNTAIRPALLIEELGSELRALSERVARLEANQHKSEDHSPPFAPIPVPESISEELLLVISAAVAAFLGERAQIRQVRLTRSPAWGQQGRVSIQASHDLRR